METKRLDPERKRLNFAQKVGYGVGDMGENFCWTLVSSFILIYCTNAVGLDAAIVGTLMMASKFFDGVTDLVMGRIIDRTKSKMGKSRFWLFVSSFPLALSTIMLFNVPGSFTDAAKYAYIFIIYTLMGAVFYTMSNISYASLSAMITKNADERMQLQSMRFIFATIGILVLSSVTSRLVNVFGGGQDGWRVVSIMYGIFCLVLVLITVASVREIPAEENENVSENAEKKPERSFVETVKILVKNKYFLYLLVYNFVNSGCGGVMTGILVYYVTYTLKNADLQGLIGLVGYVPAILILPLVPKLSDKFGVQRTSFVGYIVVIAGSVIAYLGGASSGLVIIIGGLVIRALGLGPFTAGSNVMIAQADDYSELKFGERATGMIFSCSSIGGKIGTGIGTAVCGFIISWSGFNNELAVQSQHTQNVFMNAYFLPALVAAVFTLFVISRMDVEKANRKLREEL